MRGLADPRGPESAGVSLASLALEDSQARLLTASRPGGNCMVPGQTSMYALSAQLGNRRWVMS